MNELVIHIGMPKTGTSSLQRFLACNPEALAKHGWYYPDSRGNFNDETVDNDGRWANGGLYPFVNGYCKGDKDWGKAFDKFINVVDDSLKLGNVIISEESLWFDLEGIDFLSFMKERYGEFRVVTYLRRQDDEVISLYSQLIRNINMLHGLNHDECIESIESFIEKIISGESYCAQIFDYKSKLLQIERIIGIRNISVFVYEDVRYRLKEQFVEWLGVAYTEFQSIGNVNVTSNPLDTEVKRRFNEAFLATPDAIRRYLDIEYRNISDHKVIYGNDIK